MRINIQLAPFSLILKRSKQNDARPCMMKRYALFGLSLTVWLRPELLKFVPLDKPLVVKLED